MWRGRIGSGVGAGMRTVARRRHAENGRSTQSTDVYPKHLAAHFYGPREILRVKYSDFVISPFLRMTRGRMILRSPREILRVKSSDFVFSRVLRMTRGHAPSRGEERHRFFLCLSVSGAACVLSMSGERSQGTWNLIPSPARAGYIMIKKAPRETEGE